MFHALRSSMILSVSHLHEFANVAVVTQTLPGPGLPGVGGEPRECSIPSATFPAGGARTLLTGPGLHR